MPILFLPRSTFGCQPNTSSVARKPVRAAIEKYAEAHCFEIVQTYSDAAKSGVALKRRAGLRQLLQDVVSGIPAFRAILVYDVSRWGRFHQKACWLRRSSRTILNRDGEDWRRVEDCAALFADAGETPAMK